MNNKTIMEQLKKDILEFIKDNYNEKKLSTTYWINHRTIFDHFEKRIWSFLKSETHKNNYDHVTEFLEKESGRELKTLNQITKEAMVHLYIYLLEDNKRC